MRSAWEAGESARERALPQWVISIRIAAYVQPKLLVVEEIRTRGAGWYRNWLAFVIELARIERRAVRLPANAADEVVDAFRALASDVHPFKGSPRACDLYYGRGAIHESFQIALNLLQTPEQWRRAIAHLKKISSGTTTSASALEIRSTDFIRLGRTGRTIRETQGPPGPDSS
ncbi:MAG: hypothetical protein WDM80_12565 [Limisphaerales bacterium]